MKYNVIFFSRYNENLELEDAIHTAILTLKVSYYFKLVSELWKVLPTNHRI